MRKEVLLLGIKLTGGALKDFKEVPVKFTNGDEEERDPYIASVASATCIATCSATLYIPILGHHGWISEAKKEIAPQGR